MLAILKLAFFLRSEESSGKLQLDEREDMEDEEVLSEAIHKRIDAGDVKKLQDARIFTCNGLMMHTKKNLTGIKALSEAKVDKICEAAEKLVNSGYIIGSDALLNRKSVVRITTGSQALDELLGGKGGIEILSVTEAFGDFRSGITQVAHTLCVSTQLPTNMKGGNGKVAYIDTEGTFGPDRIVAIAERFGMDPGAVLDNIIYSPAYTYEHQYNLLLGLAAKMAKESFRLLIVDSIIALFHVDSTERGELAERQQKLAQMLSRLIKIAEEFNVAVYMTNQVIADPGGGMLITDPKKLAGGHVLPQAATIRPMRKGKGEQHVCKPNLQEAETRTPELTRKSQAPLLYFFVMIFCSLMGTTQAFHHYIYAQTWAPTSCYWNPCSYTPVLMENRFVLHGLWPAFEHIPDWYIECNHPDGQNLFSGPYPLNDPNLLRDMHYYWPGLRMHDFQFWEYQWRRHGTCSHLEKTTYAAYAIQVHSSIDVFNAMRDRGIHPIPHTFIPYQLHSRERLKRIIGEHFPEVGAAEPELICNGFRELEEIRQCISRVTGNYINCNTRGNCGNWFRFVIYRSQKKQLQPHPMKVSLQISKKRSISSPCSEQHDNQASAQQCSKRRREFNLEPVIPIYNVKLEQLEKAYDGLVTSRLAHYHDLWDGNNFTADGVQFMTNNLCYTYARCTRSMSIVPPAYNVHLAAFRARFYMELVTQEKGSTADGNSSHRMQTYDQDPYAKEFGINFSEKLASVEARILPAPWEFNLEPVIPIYNAKPEQVEKTLKHVYQVSTNKTKGKELELLLAILPDNNGSLYGDLKRICETDLGIISQCCLTKPVFKMTNQYLANVSLKINVKMGGRKTVLLDAVSYRIPLVSDIPTIILGADVTHPENGEDTSPSIAAVVASQDWPEVTKYAGLVCAQAHRQELIQDLNKTWHDPVRGTVSGGMIRDGVSEGQFYQALLYELDAVQKACASLEPNYQPPVTFVVEQKRHHTRLFPNNHRDRSSTDKSGNILPGTVVDTKICHPTDFDFYLCSHAGIQGTSRPADYHVDENNFTADGVQTLTNNLLYYARCTRSVSILPPAYYTHLAAFRARLYMEPVMQENGSTADGNSSHSSKGTTRAA